MKEVITQKERFKLEEEWGQWLKSVKWVALSCEKMGFSTRNAVADHVDRVYEWMHRHAWDAYFADMILRLMDDVRKLQKWYGCAYPHPPQSLVMFLKSLVNAPIPLVDYT